MSEQLVLAAERRDRAGKGAARATRRAGSVPAVIYGDNKAAELISIDPIELRIALKKRSFFSALLSLKLDGKQHTVLPRDVQLHPVTDVPMHADFMRVNAASKIRVFVPVRFVNQEICEGLKRGGVLNIVRREIEVVCPVNAMPKEITVDLSGLDITDSVHISAVKLPPNVRSAITSRDFTIASIAAPTARIEEQRAAVAAAAAAAAASAAGELAAVPGVPGAPAAPGAPGAPGVPAAGAPAAAAPVGGGKTGAPAAAGAKPAAGAAKPAAGGDKKPGGKG